MSEVDRTDPTTWPTYDPETHRALILKHADDLGETGFRRYPDGTDWDAVYLRLEEITCIAFPTTTDDPLYGAIQRTYRKAWREANG